MSANIPKWFRLDNAAKIYPAFASKEDTATFRVSAILYESVNPEQLQRVLESINHHAEFFLFCKCGCETF